MQAHVNSNQKTLALWIRWAKESEAKLKKPVIVRVDNELIEIKSLHDDISFQNLCFSDLAAIWEKISYPRASSKKK